MKWFILMISTLAVVQSRPQILQDPTVELEKQDLIELHPTQRRIEENTKEILEKIAEVNKKQGLQPKRSKPSYFHFPFSYSRSQDEKNTARKSTSFKFPANPFTNPIFDYLERKDQPKDSSRQSSEVTEPPAITSFEFSQTNPNAEITKEDMIPGQYIKRKITHQQMVMVPNPMYSSNYQQMVPSQYPNLNNQQVILSKGSYPMGNLQEQTVDNVKNIVSNTQMFQPQTYYNPYIQQPNQYQYQYQYNPQHQQPINPQTKQSNYQLYGPYLASGGENRPSARQNWNWPGAGFFPIVVRDPFVQMYNAFTSMIEYGPMASLTGGCRPANANRKKLPSAATTKDEVGRIPKIIEQESRDLGKITFEMSDEPSGVTVSGLDIDHSAELENSTFLDIEDLNIGSGQNNPMKFTVNVKTPSDKREGKENESSKALKKSWDYKPKESGKSATLHNASTIRQQAGSKLEKFDNFKQSPPVRAPPSLIEEDLDDEVDSDEKAEDISITNDNNKKVFTRENTGSGIFIHKLKVRKGGVAIAGPGGIATAGSGGTAIVGPNGVAYTHPDSLAIAGSGTKVIAVDPLINLSDLVHNATLVNRTSVDITSRVGKVVAVGPVVYYNKGTPSKVTILPFYGGGKGQSLQITESPDGQVTTTIIKTPENLPEPEEEHINAAELEYPPLPSKHEIHDEFGSNIQNIHNTASEIIKLQELAKQNGQLSQSQQTIYKNTMEALSQSAQNLAKLQEQSNPFDFETREGLSAWFERKNTNKKDKSKKKEEEEKKRKQEEEKKKKEEEEKKEKEKEEEERKKQEKEEEEEEVIPENEEEDGVAVNLPPEDASVAEAKPVGLAVAGVGGVAASKPIATAVVGPGGLAIARPVGTAIAGVAPDQALVPIYAEGYVSGLNKPKRNGATPKHDSTSDLLNKIIGKYHQN